MSKNRKQNPFMEWLSDNLRYVILVAVIFLVLAGLFFGIRAISNRVSGGNQGGKAASGESGTASASAGALSTASLVFEDSTAHGGLVLDGDMEITQVIRDYYAGMSAKDTAAVQKVTDTLPEEQVSLILSQNRTYSNVAVYTKNGPTDDTKIVYAYYTYQTAGDTATYPGLSQMMVRKDASGAWKIVFSPLTDAEKSYIEEVNADPDVQTLIETIQKELLDAQAAASGSTASKAEKTESKKTESKKAESEKTDSKQTESEKTESEPAESEEAPTEVVTEDQVVASPESGGELPEDELVEEEAEPEEVEEDEFVVDGLTGDGEEEETEEETVTDALVGDDSEPRKAEETTGEEWSAYANSSCNVREGAGYDFNVIGSVTAGTPVTVIGDIDNGWWHIRTDNGLEGYIGGKFID